MDDTRSPWRVLGIPPDSPVQTIREAYKDLVKAWNPDRFTDSPRMRERAEATLREIDEAFDRALALAQMNADAAQSTPIGSGAPSLAEAVTEAEALEPATEPVTADPLRDLWAEKSDGELLEAIREIGGYAPQAQEVIRTGVSARPEVASAARALEEANENPSRPLFLYIPVPRLILLSLASWGLFESYWVYKNWRYVAERDALRISPFWRGWFCLFWFGELLDRISKDETARGLLQPTFRPRVLNRMWVLLYVLIYFCGRASGDDAMHDIRINLVFFGLFWLFSLFSVLCLVPVQRYVNSVVRGRCASARYYGWSMGHVICVAWGLLLCGILVTSSVNGYTGAKAAEVAWFTQIRDDRRACDRQYRSELAGIGVLEVLKPEFAAKDAGRNMQESLRRCHEARGALQRHVDGLAGVFDRAQARLDSVPVDDAAKAEMLRLAKGSSGHEDAERRAIADLDKASFGAMEDIARLLRSRRGHWGVEGGRFMFDDAATLQHYNRQLEHLRAFELQESKLLTGSSPRNANATSM